jgi:hypothetical protein
MLRFAVKLALSAAVVWALWTFVPIKGRTLAERWQAAGSFSAFAESGWAEVSGGRPAPRPQARQKPAPRERPTEGHTEADRRALDRILNEHLPERR